MEVKSKWKCVDDDRMQHVRRLDCYNGSTFQLIEMGRYGRDEFEVYADIICINDYLYGEMHDELTMILGGFGYGVTGLEKDSAIKDVEVTYGDEAKQVMAECIFEWYGSFQAETCFVGTEEECIAFIEKYVAED